MRVQDYGELLMLAAIWGMSFFFMKTATPEFGAISLVVVRTGVAFAVLLPMLLMARRSQIVQQHWRAILLVGITNTALPFCLFSYSTVHLGAGFASILNATAPMFGALIAFLWLKERLTIVAVVGLFLGFIGVVVISNARAEGSFYLALLPVLAALVSTCGYGFSVCYTKRFLSGVDTLAIAAGSQGFAALVLTPLAIFTWPAVSPSPEAWLHVIILGVLCTGLAYILYFRLIANIGASRALSVAYLVPVFGVMWGMLFLAERLSTQLLLGACLIFVGVGMTSGIIRRRQKAVL